MQLVLSKGLSAVSNFVAGSVAAGTPCEGETEDASGSEGSWGPEEHPLRAKSDNDNGPQVIFEKSVGLAWCRGIVTMTWRIPKIDRSLKLLEWPRKRKVPRRS